MAITNQCLKRLFCHANQGFQMDRRGLWPVDLRKGLKMVADRIVPWQGKRSTIVNKQIITKVPIFMVLFVKD